jgi:hypothetical protein
MKNLAVAYGVNRRNKMAKGGAIREPMLKEQEEAQDMCPHGGRSMCTGGCFAKGGQVNPKLIESRKMADGGMIDEDSDDLKEIGWDLDTDGRDLDRMEAEDETGSDATASQVLNEDGDPMGDPKDDNTDKPNKSKLLRRILGALAQVHMGKRF